MNLFSVSCEEADLEYVVSAQDKRSAAQKVWDAIQVYESSNGSGVGSLDRFLVYRRQYVAKHGARKGMPCSVWLNTTKLSALEGSDSIVTLTDD